MNAAEMNEHVLTLERRIQSKSTFSATPPGLIPEDDTACRASIPSFLNSRQNRDNIPNGQAP